MVATYEFVHSALRVKPAEESSVKQDSEAKGT